MQVRIEVAGPRGKAAFARQLAISPTTYQSYERDRIPPADVLVKMADLAQVDLRWLLTGQSASGLAPKADHPAVQRAAALLARCPNAAAPLAAFVDILSASMDFPSKDAAQGGDGASGEGPGRSGEPRGADGIAGGAAAVGPSAAPRGRALGGQGGDQTDVQADQTDVPGDTEGWIPILGRSAAGVPCFWDAGEAGQGVVTLGELIAKHASGVRQTRPARARAEGSAGDDTVQLILLTGADAGEVVEFVSASAIKARYPDAFAVRIDGQSMSPEIRHGDVVVLSPTQQARDGHSAVVQLHRQIGVTCKLLRRQGDAIHLVPINEQFHPQTFAAADLEWSLRVLARVRATPAE